MNNRNLLVPHDFTKAAGVATRYAISLAKKLNAEVNLVHIVKDSKGIPKANRKFDEVMRDLEISEDMPKVTPIVRIGDIFTDISALGKELHSSIIVMGTHGARGMQKVFGSFAIKIITSTHIPFIIVQEDHQISELEHIVVPIDVSKESLQIEQVVSAIAKKANADVKVIAEQHTDTSLKIKTAVNYKVITEQFDSVGIKYHTEFIKRLSAKDIIQFTEENDGDLIGIAYHSDNLLPQFDRIFQDLLMNEKKFPILIINAKEVGNYFF